MSRNRYPAPYLRYLKARLWNLGRPGFWGTAIFLSLVGLLIREYWTNPSFLTQSPTKEVTSQNLPESSLSQEDKAIAADIDNLPVLLSEFEQISLPSTVITDNKKQKPNNTQGFLEDLIKQRQSAANDAKSNSALGIATSVSAPKVKNPFVAQAENILQTGTIDRSNQLLGINSFSASQQPGATTSPTLGIGLTNRTNYNQTTAAISPLQAALNASTNQNISTLNPGQLQNSQTLSPNTNLNPATAYSVPSVNNLSPNPSFSTVTPAIPTTTFSVQTPSQTIAPSTTPQVTDNYTNSGLQPTPIPQPNITPLRPIAGQYGGVEINGSTFP